ncbi:MAG: zf-HC2 domain-containing protein [bacterium]
MDHNFYQELITQYVDHELEDTRASELFAHLSGCDWCRRFMKSTLLISAHITNDYLTEVPSALDRRLFGSIAKERREQQPHRWWETMWLIRVLMPLPAALSIAILIALGSLIVSPMVLTRDTPVNDYNTQLSKLPREYQERIKAIQ